MYGNDIVHNDAARLEMGRLDGHVTQVWRFRHIESTEHKVFGAAVAKAREFLSERLRRTSAATRPVQESLSY